MLTVRPIGVCCWSDIVENERGTLGVTASFEVMVCLESRCPSAALGYKRFAARGVARWWDLLSCGPGAARGSGIAITASVCG